MKFLLFSKISFEVTDPVALIESYCFQSDFYANYDLILNDRNREVKDVTSIGARIGGEPLKTCEVVTKNTGNLRIFEYNLAGFLKLDNESRNSHIKELNEKVIEKLLGIDGIALSRATKILHTLYPEIIPMIDRALQEEYRKEISSQWTEKGWTEKQPHQILIDYYNNFKKGDNWQNLTEISNRVCSNNIKGLTKVRIFDILWWSYLKSKKLRQEKNIDWSTIR